MSKLAKALTAAAGNAAGEYLYVEDVFSTNLYVGNSSALVVDTGLDQQTEGGMLWVKSRSDIANNGIWDTERTNGYYLPVNSTDNGGNISAASGSVPFLRDGSFRWDSHHNWFNNSSSTYAAWAFRKAEKFFDVVTYTGDGAYGRALSHNLGSAPAAVFIKRTDASGDWLVWHKDLSSLQKTLKLNTTDAEATTNYIFYNGQGASTDTTFGNLGGYNLSNELGATYVAYLFASDAGGFGDDGSESIIKCGSYTGNGGDLTVDLGFEPQFVIIKNSTNAYNWQMHDNMRGVSTGGNDARLHPNLSSAEATDADWLDFNATGFTVHGSTGGNLGANGHGYIYIAIRRPMKTPESGTEVFAAAYGNGSGSSPPTFTSGFAVDSVIGMYSPTTYGNAFFASRLTGNKVLRPSGTNVEGTETEANWDYQDGVFDWTNLTGYFSWMFKRATGFFDVVAYTGTNTLGRSLSHNLGVTPELVIFKRRDGVDNWVVANSNTSQALYLMYDWAANSGLWSTRFGSSSVFTATSITLGNTSNAYINENGTYIAYLFATLAGVSKVGSYTGTGSNVDVDCGFSAGARFILIKRTDSTGDWYVWDSVRGIVAGNDPYKLLNTDGTDVTSTDYIDPLASGFTVTSSAPAALNASGGTYIFLAIA